MASVAFFRRLDMTRLRALQVAWGDAESGISFAFVTNTAMNDPSGQMARTVRLSTLANACAAAPRL